MQIGAILFSVFVVAGCLTWLWIVICGLRMIHAVPVLANLDPQQPQRWPKLSILIPACNEADTIGGAMKALLSEDYPNLEIILIDDRSTDGTQRIIDEIAASDPRVRAVHIAELPDGWLGKVNALHQALSLASGEFLLFTDADIHFAPGTLRKVIAHAEQRNFDHITALPHMLPDSFALDSVISTFGTLFMLTTQIWRVEDPKSKAFVGIGAFNLVRRSAFSKTPGFEWLKLEIVDDVGLGLMMKRSGARCSLINARNCISLHWYRTLGQFARGAERTWATLARFSMMRVIVLSVILAALAIVPFLGLLPLILPRLAIGPVWAGVPAITWLALATILIKSAMALVSSRWTGRRALPGLLLPLGVALLIGAMIRGGIVCRRRGGIVWRGVLYPTSVLQGQQRVGYA